jgi:hypothetical protein
MCSIWFKIFKPQQKRPFYAKVRVAKIAHKEVEANTGQ